MSALAFKQIMKQFNSFIFNLFYIKSFFLLKKIFPILLALFIAQIISTTFVYISNIRIYKNTQAIIKTGYLSVPNKHVLPALEDVSTAFLGGLFFTFSSGMFLILFSYFSTWTIKRHLANKKALFFLFLLWLFLIIISNQNGIAPIAICYFSIIPFVVFIYVIKKIPDVYVTYRKSNFFLHIIFFFIFVLTCLYFIKIDSFIKIRDNMLFSNPFGKKINNFYYEYSIYPAQIFKPVEKKILKTCDLSDIDNKDTANAIEKKLLLHHYINTHKNPNADLKISNIGDNLIFTKFNKPVLNININFFLDNTNFVLHNFSQKSDCYTFFRIFTFFSIIALIAFFIYIFIFITFSLLIKLLIVKLKLEKKIIFLNFITAVFLVFWIFSEKPHNVNISDLNNALNSNAFHTRLEALKHVYKNKIEISCYNVCQKMMQSKLVPERYMLAKVLGVSRDPNTLKNLVKLANDRQINVACMAFYSLGKRRDKMMIKNIIKQIQTSTIWYTQLYAYTALKNLKWTQTKSK